MNIALRVIQIRALILIRLGSYSLIRDSFLSKAKSWRIFYFLHTTHRVRKVNFFCPFRLFLFFWLFQDKWWKMKMLKIDELSFILLLTLVNFFLRVVYSEAGCSEDMHFLWLCWIPFFPPILKRVTRINFDLITQVRHDLHMVFQSLVHIIVNWSKYGHGIFKFSENLW